jgi:hypothetical protein
MPYDEIIPSSYESWRHCITQKCSLELTPDYIAARLAALRDPADAHTRDFIRVHGAAHLEKIIGWFTRAASTHA